MTGTFHFSMSTKFYPPILNASGVEYLHSLNIVHLDLKPENIVCVDEDSFQIKVVDFGLARRLDDNQATCVMQGTPDFVSPEVWPCDMHNMLDFM